jgi:hypothetical protein
MLILGMHGDCDPTPEPKQPAGVSGLRLYAWEVKMGRGILLWMLGVPIPVIILLALLWH